jgi:hypothetical protein
LLVSVTVGAAVARLRLHDPVNKLAASILHYILTLDEHTMEAKNHRNGAAMSRVDLD